MKFVMPKNMRLWIAVAISALQTATMTNAQERKLEVPACSAQPAVQADWDLSETEFARLTEQATKQGDAEAAFQLFGFYEWAVRGEHEKGLPWLRRSAELGNVLAQSHLGYYLVDGGYDDASRREGKEWLQRAANAGQKDAIRILDCLKNGKPYKVSDQVSTIAVSANDRLESANGPFELSDKNIAYYTNRAEKQSDPEAAFWLYKYYLYAQDGKGKMLLWGRRAAELGKVSVQYTLGLYLVDEARDEVTTQEGIDWLQRAAKVGDKGAAIELEKIRKGVFKGQVKNTQP